MTRGFSERFGLPNITVFATAEQGKNAVRTPPCSAATGSGARIPAAHYKSINSVIGGGARTERGRRDEQRATARSG